MSENIKSAYIYMRNDEDYISVHNSFMEMMLFENIKNKPMAQVLFILDGCAYYLYGCSECLITKVANECIRKNDGTVMNIVDYIAQRDAYGVLEYDDELAKALRGEESTISFE